MQAEKLNKHDNVSVGAFMEKHKRLAISIANKQGKRGIEMEDLQQEAMYGLYLATMRYDESTGFKFSTFAVPTIRGTVLKYIRDKEHGVRVPRERKYEFYNYKELEMQVGSEAAQEILGYTDDEITELGRINDLINPKSLNYRIDIHNERGIEVVDAMADPLDMEFEVISTIGCEEIIQLIRDNLGEEYVTITKLKANETTYTEITRQTGYSYTNIVKKIEEIKELLLEKWL